MRTRALLALSALAVTAHAGEAGAAATAPTETGAPWPSMRHDPQNTGRSPIRGRYEAGRRPWSYTTGKGVFSTPVVGADGTVYAGSADTWFYAVGPRGRLRWRFKTGEIIDSAAVLGRGHVTRKALSQRQDRWGNIREVRLRIPRGTRLPPRLDAHVIVDVFPLARRRL